MINNQQQSSVMSNNIIALDDNPISQQYECLQPKINHASAGPALIWLIYAAKKRDLGLNFSLNPAQNESSLNTFSDAISNAYTSLKQRNSFSGLTAALAGTSSPNTDTTKIVKVGTQDCNNKLIDGQDEDNNIFHDNFAQFLSKYGRCCLGQVPIQHRLYNQLLQQHINAILLGNKLPDRVSIFFYDKKSPQLFENNNNCLAQQMNMLQNNASSSSSILDAMQSSSSYLQFGTSIKYKKKDLTVAQDLLRSGVKQLERNRQMKMLSLLQAIEESTNTIAFVTEAILYSLQNCIDLNNNLGLPLVYMGQETKDNIKSTTPGNDDATSKINQSYLEQQLGYHQLTQFEIKYGLLQITEALLYLHYSSKMIHRNINAKTILINIRGTWKLTGLEFALKCNNEQGLEPTVSCPPYNNKINCCIQPELDYFAPEIQLRGSCSPQSDMFSLGILITQIFNYKAINDFVDTNMDQNYRTVNCGLYQNKPLLDCQKNSNNYLKQVDQLNYNLQNLIIRLPRQLEEPLKSLLDIDPKKRLNSESFSMINYFTNDGIHALEYLDMINTKDSAYKSSFYYNLTGVLHQVPKKMWYQHILPSILDEIQRNELMATTIEPILYILNNSNNEELELILLPSIRLLFYVPKSVQATVSLLDNFHIIVNRIRRPIADLNQNQSLSQQQQQQLHQISQLMLNSLDSSAVQIQSSSLDALIHIVDFVEHDIIGLQVIHKIRQIFEANIADINIQLKVLKCIDCFLKRLNRIDILNNVLPVLFNTKMDNHLVLIPLIDIYRGILNNNELRSALSCDILATHVMPTILPALVCPNVSMNEFSLLIELIQDMLNSVNDVQRHRIKSGLNTQNKEDQAYIENWSFGKQPPVCSNTQKQLHHNRTPVTSAHQSIGRASSPNQATTKVNGNDMNTTKSAHISKPLDVPSLPLTMITSASPLENSLNESLETDNYDDLMSSIDQYFNDDTTNNDQEFKSNLNGQQHTSLRTQSPSINLAQSTQVSPVHAFRMKEKEQQNQRPPTLRLEKRRTSISMDDVVRRMSMNASSSCLLGKVTGSISDNKNSSNNFAFLKVNNQTPGRRHSDNTILPPKILIAPSSPDHSIASRLGSKLKLNLSNQKLSSSTKNSKCNLAAAAVNYTRRHSSANDNQPSISPSLFLNSSTFKTKSSTNLGFDFLTNRSMKRRYSTASMLGHQTQRKAENLIESIGSAGMKGMQQIFGK